jgi:hypothetical protein
MLKNLNKELNTLEIKSGKSFTSLSDTKSAESSINKI